MAADVAENLPAPPATLTPGRVAPDPHRLTAHAADADRTVWWRRRLTRCHALLAAGHPAWPPARGLTTARPGKTRLTL